MRLPAGLMSVVFCLALSAIVCACGDSSGCPAGEEKVNGVCERICPAGYSHAIDGSCYPNDSTTGDGDIVFPDGDLGDGDSGEVAKRPDMIAIESGTFTMGSPTWEVGRIEYWEARHDVTLTHNFEIAETEVTQIQYKAITGWNGSKWGKMNREPSGSHSNHPVEYVSWFDALAYANRLSNDEGLEPCFVITDAECYDGGDVGDHYNECWQSAHTTTFLYKCWDYDKNQRVDCEQFVGSIVDARVSLNGVGSVYDCEGYRLPTEAEWEYAARAGTLSPFSKDEEKEGSTIMKSIGWYSGNSNVYHSEPQHRSVSQKEENPWGLYDMHGNIAEWSWNLFDRDYQDDNTTDPEGERYMDHYNSDPIGAPDIAVRGGNFLAGWEKCRSASRNSVRASMVGENTGFRIVRTLHD